MAAQNPELVKVNLLVHKEQPLPTQVKFFKWLLSSGRYIVIFVDLLVIATLVLRYKLDADLVHLQEQIQSQVAYIQSLKDDELAIKKTQFQLSTIKQVRAEGSDLVQVVDKLAKLTPTSITLTNVTLDRTKTYPVAALSITGTTPSNLELSAFIKALQKDPDFTDISLTNINYQEKTTFTIVGTMTKKGAK